MAEPDTIVTLIHAPYTVAQLRSKLLSSRPDEVVVVRLPDGSDVPVVGVLRVQVMGGGRPRRWETRLGIEDQSCGG